jgi:hypothetical protein
MSDREKVGHEPERPDDKHFAPVNEGEDARGRTAAEAGENGRSGTGVPGVGKEHPDTLPPTEEGVREAERHDDSR